MIPTLLLRSKKVPYRYRDLFLTDLPPGSINNTPSTPGPGTRIAPTDTAGIVSISGGALVTNGTGVSSTDPLLYLTGTIDRETGLTGRVVFKVSDIVTKDSGVLGWIHPADVNISHTVLQVYYAAGPPSFNIRCGGARRVGYVLVSNRWMDCLISLRATGAMYYFNDGLGYRLVFVENINNHSPLYFGQQGYVASMPYSTSVSALEVYFKKWVHLSIASDSFNRANGALGNTDGAGCEEGGGAGLAWTDISGTTEISTNVAKFSALTGGIGISVVDPGLSNIYVHAKTYRSAGSVGLVVKYVDAQNYLLIYYDGTNLKVDRVVGGATTNVYTMAATYAAGAYIAVAVDEMNVHCYYNDGVKTITYVCFPGAANLPLSGTKVGLYSTNTSNSFDDFAAWDLFPILPFPTATLKVVNCFGDSLTSGLNRYTGALRQALGDAWVTRDSGVPSQDTTMMLTRFNLNVILKSDPYVVILGGINDIAADVAAASIEAYLQAMYTAAHNAGKTVIALTLFPWKNSIYWTAGRQVITDAVNTWILNTAVNVDYKIDTYTALEDPGAPDCLLAAYDDGSHLHTSWAGAQAAAAAIVAGVPFS